MASKDSTIGVKEVAARVGTDPKTLRVLRAQGIGVGSGKRYPWPSMSDATVRKDRARVGQGSGGEHG